MQVNANRLELQAHVAERSPLRFSPAGIPVLDCMLEHRSEQMEAGSKRQVTAMVKTVAIGPLAEQLDKLTLGQEARFTGFMATPAQRGGVVRSPRLVFHLQAFQVTEQPF